MLDSTNIILGGYFNLYLDPHQDKGPYIKDNDNDNCRNDKRDEAIITTTRTTPQNNSL